MKLAKKKTSKTFTKQQAATIWYLAQLAAQAAAIKVSAPVNTGGNTIEERVEKQEDNRGATVGDVYSRDNLH